MSGWTGAVAGPRRALRQVWVVRLLVVLALALVSGLGAASSRAQEGPLPTVGAAIDWDGVWVSNWTPGSTVTVTVGGGAGIDVITDSAGNAQVGRTDVHGVDIVAGTVITATDDTTSKTLTVADVAVTKIDAAADTVAGTAPEGVPLHVSVSVPEASEGWWLNTTAGPDGRWLADFTSVGADVTLGMMAAVEASDADGDQSQNSRQPSNVVASIDGDSIFLGNWTPGSEVGFQIGEFGGSATIGSDGTAMVRKDVHGVDIVAGMTVTANDDTVTKTLTVADLQITKVDAETDVVSGIAPAGATVKVGIKQGNGGAPLVWLDATADSGGHWSAHFADVTIGMSFQALVGDDDGDGTSVEWHAPWIHASIPYDWVSLNNWTPNTTVTLTIDGAAQSVAVDGSGNAWIDRQVHGHDVVTGTAISVSDDKTTKELLVPRLGISAVDLDADTVTGVAQSGAAVHVSIDRNGSTLGQRDATADTSGNWSVDFKNGADSVDITLGLHVWAGVTDPDGDMTSVERGLQTPTVGAAIDGNGISLNNWEPNSTVTLDIGGFHTSATVNGQGNASLGPPAQSQDVVPGMTITATDGSTSKTLVVADLHIGKVDMDADTVTGTAPAAANVWVGVTRPNTPVVSATVVADANGNWRHDFHDSVDLAPGMGVSANVADEDGDTTTADRFLQMPTVGAGSDGNGVWLNNWTPSGTVMLHIGGFVTSVTTDQWGNGNLNPPAQPVDITPGMTITASDGTITKALIVADVRITSVDLDADTVSGIAPPGASVWVGINKPNTPGPVGSMNVVADEHGNWTAAFHGSVDITMNMGVNANVSDDDGDMTSANRFLQMPNVVASIVDDWVSLSDWTPNGTVTLHVGGYTGTVTVDGSGNAFIGRQIHGQNIVAGTAITASDGTTTKTLVVADLRVSSVDMGADTAAGIAPAGATLHVWASQGNSTHGQADPTANENGDWGVDFGALGVDLTPAVQVFASVNDEDGDGTMTAWINPGIETSIANDWVSLGNWTPGSSVTLHVGAYTGSVDIDEYGTAWIDSWVHGQDVAAGTTITASDGTTTRTLVVADLRITSVDLDANTVSGEAPPDAVVYVFVDWPGGFGQAQATADGTGHWLADFDGDFDIALGMNVTAQVIDQEGNRTDAEYGLQPPILRASIDGDWISLAHWVPGTDVRLDVGGVQLYVPIGESGGAWVDPALHGQDLVAGTTISATDDTTTKELVVADLRITSVDVVADTVAGTAPPMQWLTVFAGGFGAPGGTQADETGRWLVSFADMVDITVGMTVGAETEDADYDLTQVEQVVGGLTVEAGGPYTVAEGASIGLHGSATGGKAPLRYRWSAAAGKLAHPDKAAATFTGLDDGTVELTLAAADKAGLTGADTAAVTVTNRPPSISHFKVGTGPQRRVELGAGIADPGLLDTHVVSVQWGDGSESAGVVTEKNGKGTVVASHQYVRKGAYGVTLTVRDDDGGTCTVQQQVTVH